MTPSLIEVGALNEYAALSRARAELAIRNLAWKTVWYLLVARRLYRGPRWMRSLAAWGLALSGSIGYTPRTCELEERLRIARFDRDFAPYCDTEGA